MSAQGGERISRLFGSAGKAVRIRGMLLHPGQIQAALSRLPEVARAQAVITRAGGQDHLLMRIELRPEGGRAHIEQGVINTLQAMAHVRVDAVEVVSEGTIDATLGLIRDERR
jgi:phenylacetate-CoA ligase